MDDDLEVLIPPTRKIEVDATEQKFNSNRKEQKVEQNILEQKVEPNLMNKNIAGSPVSEKPVASLSKSALSSGGLLSSNDPGKAVPTASVDNNTGFAFSNAPPGTRPATAVSAMPLASINDDKKTSVSNSSFGLKQSIASDSEASAVKNKSTLGQRWVLWILVSFLYVLWTIYIIVSKNVHHNCNILFVSVRLSMKLVRLGVSSWMWIL